MARAAHLARVACVHALCLIFACFAAVPARAETEVRRIIGLRVAAEGRGLAITLTSPGAVPLTTRSFTLEEPRRLVFDLQDASLATGITPSVLMSVLGISQLRAHQFSADPPVARLVLDAEGDLPLPTWSVRPGTEPGDTIIVLAPPDPVMLALPTVEMRDKRAEVRLAGAGALAHQGGGLDNPPRVFFDFAYATTPASARQSFASGPVREIRIAPRTRPDGTPAVRLAVELAQRRVFSEAAAGDDLVISFAATSAKDPLIGKVIVIDPGHGGGDSGAPSAGEGDERVLEKDITLDIAVRLAKLLRARGVSVTMTREDDSSLPLHARSDLANGLRADAFISVHCNSCSTLNALQGTSVYYDHPHSAVFAQVVQEELVRALGRRDNGIRNANFSVIRRAECPGILVETAFLNHDEELVLLSDPRFREKAAAGILAGVVRFLTGNPSGAAAE